MRFLLVGAWSGRPRTHRDLGYFVSKAVGQTKDSPASDMDAYIRRLEEEWGKIEVFRRELPLCAHLLADGEKTYSFSLCEARFGGQFFMLRCGGICAVIDVMKVDAEKKKSDHKEEDVFV